MPRARSQGKLVRIPVHPKIAYDVTYFYPPEEDPRLLEKHAAALYKKGNEKLAHTLMKALLGKTTLTIKQRLMLLVMEYPTDLRLRVIKNQIKESEGPTTRWGTAFRRDPSAAYKAEWDAVEKAKNDLKKFNTGVAKLEELVNITA